MISTIRALDIAIAALGDVQPHVQRLCTPEYATEVREARDELIRMREGAQRSSFIIVLDPARAPSAESAPSVDSLRSGLHQHEPLNA